MRKSHILALGFKTMRAQGMGVTEATASSAQHFGERALLNNAPRAATIKARNG